MKKLYTALVVIACMIANTLFSQAPPEIIHYNFNGTGTTVPNIATAPPSGANTGTILGGLTQSGVGQTGGAIVHTGSTASTDYINTGWNTSLSGSWSIAFWTSSVSTSSTLFYLFGDNTAGTFRCFTNGVAGTGNWILRGTGMTDMLITGGATMTPQHNIFVYDATAGRGSMYLNGVLQSTITQAGTASFSGTAPFKVAGYAANIGLPLNGLLDEFRIYSRAITNLEAQQIYSIFTSTNINASSCGTYTSPYTLSTFSTTGVHTQTFSAAGGNSTVSINLTVSSAPSVVAVPGATAWCAGSAWSATASGASTYSWSNALGTSSVVAGTASTNIVYTVTGLNSGSCAATATLGIVVKPNPTVAIAASNLTVCQGATVNLTASGAGSYSWDTGGNTAQITVTPGFSSDYTVTGTTNGCVDEATVSISVNANPNVTAIGPLAICLGESATLTAVGAMTYSWSHGASGFTVPVTPSVTTTYTVTGIDANNCKGMDSFTLGVYANPTVSIVNSGPFPFFCVGSLRDIVAYGANTYSWNTGVQSRTLTFAPATNTTYVVYGWDINGCSDSASFAVTVKPVPVILITGNTGTICAGESVVLNASGASNFTWTTGSVDTPSVLLTPAQTTTVTVSGTGTNNCVGSASAVQFVDPCEGLTEIGGEIRLRLFPNPGTGLFNFELEGAGHVVVYNSIGEKVLELEKQQYSGSIDLRNQASGLYYVTVISAGGKTTLKLIKE